MSDDLLAATEALCAHLDAENEALAACELGRAARMVAGKSLLAEAFRRAQAMEPAAPSPMLRDAAARLTALAERNNALLAKAIDVQAQVVQIVAGAAACSATPRVTRYGATGALPAPHVGRGALLACA